MFLTQVTFYEIRNWRNGYGGLLNDAAGILPQPRRNRVISKILEQPC
jgi:hypothetical protein